MQSIQELIQKTLQINPSNLTETELLNFAISFSSFLVALLSFIVSIIVLIYTGYQFVLKKGTKFYGMFSISSSAWSNQAYVGEVIIENKKDKSAAISYIYIRINNNIYIELADYSRSPRIIAPFETIKIEFNEGVSGYISSTYKVDVHDFLTNLKIPKTLIVATPQGLSIVKKYKKFWDVYFESLKNNLIIPVRPVRKYHKGKEYSDALMFVVTCKDEDNTPTEHFLYRNSSYTIDNIPVKTDEFKSAEELEIFLKNSSNLEYRNIKVDSANYTFRDYASYEEAEIFHAGFFETNIIGKAYTEAHRFSLKIKNRIKKIKSKL